MRLITSFLFLLIFLFPLAEKGLHAFSHEGEEHCSEHEVTHLHEKHHDCKICDYNVDTPAPTVQFEEAAAILISSEVPASHFDFTSVKEFYYFSLRAPPAVS